jgi:hypothetical protein
VTDSPPATKTHQGWFRWLATREVMIAPLALAVLILVTFAAVQILFSTRTPEARARKGTAVPEITFADPPTRATSSLHRNNALVPIERLPQDAERTQYASDRVRAGAIEVTSLPSGATIYLGGRIVGETPYDLQSLDMTQPHQITVAKEGYAPCIQKVEFGPGSTWIVHCELIPIKPDSGHKEMANNVTPALPRAAPVASSTGTCSGSGFKLSVMASETDCRVTVGGVDLGAAPFYKKDTPTGTCKIRIVCPSGRNFIDVRALRPGGDAKILPTDKGWSK